MLRNSNRFHLLLPALLGILGLVNSSPAIAAEKPLNVVLILVDDLGWTDLGCYGSDFYQTPNIDQLAAEGMRFTQNYSACNACSPTRAALMTGLYPARTHLTDWIPGWASQPTAKLMTPDWTQKLEHKYTTLPEALKAAGYATYHVGKWHLGGPGWYPEDSGFDVNIAGTNRGAPASYHYPYKGIGEKWDSKLTKPEQEGLYLTDRLASEAVKLIEQSPQEKPFFLYLPFYSVHTPIEGRPDLVKKYQALPRGERHKNAEYAAMVSAMDEAVGRVRAALEKQGIADRTLIILNSDNGGLFRKGFVTSNAPLRGGKGQQWEGGTRVPAIVHWPGVTTPGSVCHEQVITMDFYPTVLEIVGAKGDAAHNAKLDGLSLVKLLKDPNAKLAREALYWHYPHYNVIEGIPHSSIRAGDYKLIEYYEDGHLELYNLAEDLGEEHNLAESQPDLAQKLHKQLRDYLQETGAQMPVPNPKYKP